MMFFHLHESFIFLKQNTSYHSVSTAEMTSYVPVVRKLQKNVKRILEWVVEESSPWQKPVQMSGGFLEK